MIRVHGRLGVVTVPSIRATSTCSSRNEQSLALISSDSREKESAMNLRRSRVQSEGSLSSHGWRVAFIWAAIVPVLLLLCEPASSRAQQKRPNILLIVADDMGWSDAGAYGGEIFTPHINGLASRGYQFLNFHVGSMCAPTRSMLMTGVDNHVVGLGNMIELVADNQRGKPGYEGRLNGRAVTIATLLHDGGYHTYMAGKWHLGYSPEALPASQGF